MNANSYERSKDKSPAYWISEFGVLAECGREIPGSRPLYWKKEPLSEERVKELFEESGKSPKVFARLIEQEHGIK